MDFSDYKGIYVVGALFDGHIRKFTGEFTGEARALADKSGEEVSVVLLGSDLKDDPQSLIALGADHVYVMDDPLLAHYDGQAYQKVLVKFFREKKPSTVIFGATPKGRDLAPRIAADLVCGVTADVTELDIDQDTGLVICSRPAMSGNILADIISPDYRPQVCTVRPGIFRSPAPDASRKGEAVHVKVELEQSDIGTILKEILKGEKDEHPIETAKGVGCSRPICELGWEPKSHQIGQTGKGVAPKVYFAFGISGVMQHMCAVNADIIIAVNKDPNAPIMAMADYAVVADIKEFIPRFIDKLKELKAEKE